MIRKRDGFTGVNIKESEKGYCAKLEDYSRLCSEFKAGSAFLEFENIFGYKITLKTALVESVILCSKEAIEAQEADDKEEEKEDAIG